MRNISKKQIQDLQIRLSNSGKNELDLTKEIESLKASLKMSQESITKVSLFCDSKCLLFIHINNVLGENIKSKPGT